MEHDGRRANADATSPRESSSRSGGTVSERLWSRWVEPTEYLDGDRPVLEVFPDEAICAGANGTPLIPWPNRPCPCACGHHLYRSPVTGLIDEYTPELDA